MALMHHTRAMPAVIVPSRKTGGAPLAEWRLEVGPTVLAMAAEMGPSDLTTRAVAQRMGLQDAQIWRALPKGRADILFLVACDLQIRQADAVAKQSGVRKRSPRLKIDAHLARMLEFDFQPTVKEWRRACAAQAWYWSVEQYDTLWGALEGPLEPISKELGGAVAAVWALYESTFRDACVMSWNLAETTAELLRRLDVVKLG